MLLNRLRQDNGIVHVPPKKIGVVPEFAVFQMSEQDIDEIGVVGEPSRYDDCDFVERLLGTLGPTTRALIRDRFGLNDAGSGQTLRQVGESRGKSSEWARVEQERAFEKMRGLHG